VRTWPVLWLTACGRLDFESAPRDAAVADDAPVDVADAAEPVVAPTCGASLIFRDDFTNAIPGPLFSVNNDPGITMSENNDRANVNFQATVPANNFAFYTTTAKYTVADLCVIADVATLPQNEGFALLKVRAGMREVEFFVSKSLFHLRTHENSALEDIVGIAPDAALRFWRVRVQNNIVHWDTSTDDITYLERHARADWFTDTTADIIIGGGAADPGTTGADIAQFESVTATGP